MKILRIREIILGKTTTIIMLSKIIFTENKRVIITKIGPKSKKDSMTGKKNSETVTTPLNTILSN